MACFPSSPDEFKIEQPIRCRFHVREDLDIGGAAGSGIGHNIEAGQQRLCRWRARS
jgi:hypothetical protein